MHPSSPPRGRRAARARRAAGGRAGPQGHGTATGRVCRRRSTLVYGFYPSMHYAARPSLPDPQAHVFFS
jgi:hypothetical protein